MSEEERDQVESVSEVSDQISDAGEVEEPAELVDEAPPPGWGGLTFRSVAIGLIGAVIIGGMTYFNDSVIGQTQFVGNNMPIAVYGFLMVFLIFGNRLLGLFGRWTRVFGRLSLRGSEIAVALAITLATCCIAGSGLMRTFTAAVVMPYHYNKTNPAWRHHDILNKVPKRMLVDPGVDDQEVVIGFMRGLSGDSGHLPVSGVPWRAFAGPISLWIPMIVCLLLAMIGLSLVYHKQWMNHEHLPYPLASFTNSLLPKPGQSTTPLMSNRLFWCALIIVLAIHTNNYIVRWAPDTWIRVPLQLDFTPLSKMMPLLHHGVYRSLFRPTIFFAAIGLAYLCATDVSASFGFGPIVWALVVGTLSFYGINAQSHGGNLGGYLAPSPRYFTLFGACLGVFLALAYSGRRYYRTTFGRALYLPVKGETDNSAVWGARFFLVLSLLFVVQLWLAGIPFVLSFFYWLILVIAYVISARVMAEGGLFHLKAVVFPCAILWGLLGTQNLGFKVILLMQMVTVVLFIDPRETLLPFMANSNYVLAKRKVKLGRAGVLAGVGLVIGLAVAIPVTLYLQYDVQGVSQRDRWASRNVPQMPFSCGVGVRQHLDGMGMLEEADENPAWAGLKRIRPNRACMIGLFAGFALVVICAAMRMKVANWPIHPMFFLVWTFAHMETYCISFILGMLLKVCVQKYGGSRMYNKLKPMVIGLIAGELLATVLPFVVGTLYFLITNEKPIFYRIYRG